MERRTQELPVKRPRSEDLRTGERVYHERRSEMRWTVNLGGMHEEGIESKTRFNELVSNFKVMLEVNGYIVEDDCCDVDDHSKSFEAVDFPESDKKLDSEWGMAVDTEDDEVPLSEQIRRLREARESGETLSQREIAEILGVTRYQVKKALRELEDDA